MRFRILKKSVCGKYQRASRTVQIAVAFFISLYLDDMGTSFKDSEDLQIMIFLPQFRFFRKEN